MKHQPAPKSSSRHSRRQFLGQAAAVAAGALTVPSLVPSSVLGADGKVAPSNRILLAIIGTGNQGFNDLRSFLGDERVQIVAVCDVNRESAMRLHRKSLKWNPDTEQILDDDEAAKMLARPYRAPWTLEG